MRRAPNVNRAIRELRELGLIETDYGRILVKNREGLVRYINDHGRQTKNNIDDE
ncbi:MULTISPECIES: helix-turn-helix domain-containing protein [unclassified Pseudomonas]|uniref:helix-turn-helix domain-containing protein n=1 Tax=unclassified Pseudomonas TaxID=196821 RepID=UPI003FA6E784